MYATRTYFFNIAREKNARLHCVRKKCKIHGVPFKNCTQKVGRGSCCNVAGESLSESRCDTNEQTLPMSNPRLQCPGRACGFAP